MTSRKLRRSRFVTAAISALILSVCGDATNTGPATTDLSSTTTTTTAAAATTTSSPGTTTTEVPELDPRVEEALDVATEFMDGYAKRNIETITATSVEGHVFGFVVDAFELFPSEFTWLDAVGWQMTVNECTITNPDLDNLKLTCSVSHENAWSRALEVGPYDGEFFLSVSIPGQANWVYEDRDRPVVTERAIAQFPTFFFTSETWDPFIEWVEANHPDDLPLMVSDLPPSDIQFLPANPSLNPESIDLWKTHTESFVTAFATDS